MRVMATALVLAVVAFCLGESAFAVDDPEGDAEPPDSTEMGALAKDMRAVGEMLQKDRHDATVRESEDAIDARLTQMILQMENPKPKPNLPPKPEPEQKLKEAPHQCKNPKLSNHSIPGENEQPGGVPGPAAESGGANNPGKLNGLAQLHKNSGAWIQLPPRMRDSMTQSAWEKLPEKWRTQVSGYFLAISLEESKE